MECKAEGKSTAVIQWDCLSLLTLAANAQMWMATFVEEGSASMVPLNGLPYGRREDQVGMPNESYHIAI